MTDECGLETAEEAEARMNAQKRPQPLAEIPVTPRTAALFPGAKTVDTESAVENSQPPAAIPCPDCDRAFGDAHALHVHQARIHGKKTMHACKRCGEPITSKTRKYCDACRRVVFAEGAARSRAAKTHGAAASTPTEKPQAAPQDDASDSGNGQVAPTGADGEQGCTQEEFDGALRKCLNTPPLHRASTTKPEVRRLSEATIKRQMAVTLELMPQTYWGSEADFLRWLAYFEDTCRYLYGLPQRAL